MKNYTKINTITGWVIFAIAAVVYLATIEPTASFWDPGEFISSAFKLEVGHPPGAPFFMLIGRFFTLFAGNNTAEVAKMVNSLSALMSAFTILFLFWTITHIVKKILIKDETDYNFEKISAIIFAGVIGSLAYTFSDTFWFSAVEGEVYATSSLFTALVFWAILKWENVADKPHSLKWIVLIAYLMGLSIGIHLLNLLAIPAIVLIYHYKHNELTLKGTIRALLLSVVILVTVMYIIIPGFVKIASYFELLFVNSFGMPYWSGVFFYLAILIALIFWLIQDSHKKNKVILNTILISITVLLIGYSSYGMIVIRSLANPPMDQNDPENPFALLGYLNREQYGDRPLFHGQYFNAPVIAQEEGKPIYSAIDGKYVKTANKIIPKYDPKYTTLFPRMWSSSESSHIDAYLRWGGIEESRMFEARMDQNGNVVRNNEGQIVYDRTKPKRSPSFGQNLRFFFRYQIGHMYLRYFMWNFAGRQNDIQAHFHEEITKGNWISGIKFIDEARLGSQEKITETLLSNKARNKYYFLPLLLGILGMIYLYEKNAKDFWTIIVLFVMTGLAIVIYLNQNPIQPRERDYAFAGSFYAFAILIGIGVLYIYEKLNKAIPGKVSILVAGILCFSVPIIMANENWDDHNRSDRYVARDFASNYLNSCAKNAIVFTNGDNDTFPLWYVQEVEGIRTDVRVVNLSYLTADWYIEQMQRKAYESDPLPFTLTKEKYVQGKRDIVYLVELLKGYTDVKQAIDFLADESTRSKSLPNYQGRIDFIPNNKFIIPVDSAKVLANGTVSSKFANHIVPQIQWTINKRYLIKNHVMVFDLIATNNWERPIYFAITVAGENYLGLDSYFQQEGLTYRFVPVKSESMYPYTGGFDSEIVYENLMNKFKWGGIGNKKVYLDENILRMLSNFRSTFARLAESLIAEGKQDSAKMVLDKATEILPDDIVKYNYFNIPMINSYYAIGEKEKAVEMSKLLSNNACNELDYLVSIDEKRAIYFDYEKRLNLHIVREVANLADAFGAEDLKKDLETKFQNYVMALKLDR